MHDVTCVESNARKDAERALELLHAQLLLAVVDPYSWKWALLALHSALQAIVASALEEAPGWSLPTQATAAATPLRVRGRLARRPDPPGHDDLPQLLAHLKRELSLEISHEVDRDIVRLSRCRDGFVRDLPTEWELGVQGLPNMARNCLCLIDQLGWNPGQPDTQSRQLSEQARAKLVASVNLLDALNRQYRA